MSLSVVVRPGDWLPAEYSPWSLIGQFAGSMPTVQAVLWHTILLLASAWVTSHCRLFKARYGGAATPVG